MNLPMTHSTEIRSGRFRRLAGLGLFGGCALWLATAGCTRPDNKPASDTGAVAAAPATTTTPPAPTTAPTPTESAAVTSVSTGETTSTTRTHPAEKAKAKATAESTRGTKHNAAPASTRHADTAAAAKSSTPATTPREQAAPPAQQPAPAKQAASATDTTAAGGQKTVAATGPAKADSTCSTENGAAGVQPAKPGPDPLLVNQSEYDGWKMFHVYCYRCHGVDALGGGIAPNLRHSLGPDGTVDHACFVKTVTEGRLAKGMPSWKTLLDPDQIENIWHYLQARSSERLAPGRPHTASKG